MEQLWQNGSGVGDYKHDGGWTKTDGIYKPKGIGKKKLNQIVYMKHHMKCIKYLKR